MASLFQMPDLSNKIDVATLMFQLTFVLLGLGANTLSLPLFKNNGGMFTYSKFAHGLKDRGPMLPTIVGMLMLYTPAGMYAAWACMGTPSLGSRSALMALLTLVHFVKRDLEVLFVHKYSGHMPLLTGINGSVTYVAVAMIQCYFAAQVPADMCVEWTWYVGVALFWVGLGGVTYHHWLLATLRKPGEKGYKVPHGGFFEYVATPHYFFELIEFLGKAILSQHLLCLGTFVWMCCYLGDRAVNQSKWNREKMTDYPKNRRHLLPFIL
jgi:protein-S-isoprenylcysteine O-methyltransferase Ste14